MHGFNGRLDQIERDLNRGEARLAGVAVFVFWLLATAWVSFVCTLPHG